MQASTNRELRQALVGSSRRRRRLPRRGGLRPGAAQLRMAVQGMQAARRAHLGAQQGWPTLHLVCLVGGSGWHAAGAHKAGHAGRRDAHLRRLHGVRRGLLGGHANGRHAHRWAGRGAHGAGAAGRELLLLGGLRHARVGLCHAQVGLRRRHAGCRARWHAGVDLRRRAAHGGRARGPETSGRATGLPASRHKAMRGSAQVLRLLARRRGARCRRVLAQRRHAWRRAGGPALRCIRLLALRHREKPNNVCI